MVNEYALKEAFSKIKEEIESLKKEIIELKEKLNKSVYEDNTEELLEMEPIKEPFVKNFEETEETPNRDNINITDSYY